MVIALALLGTLVLAPGGTAQQAPTPPMNPPVGAAAKQMTATARTLTIEEAEAIGLKNNPQSTVGKLHALEAQEFVRAARSALMPQVSLNLTGVGADPGGRLSAG